MNLKFLLSKREESRFIYYAIFQIIQLFTSLSLSLSRFINDREKEKGDALLIAISGRGRAQISRYTASTEFLANCFLASSIPNNRRRHELFFIIESGNSDLSKCPAGIITVIRGHAYSRGSSFSLETCGTGPRRVTAIERSFFFPFFL